jgi:2-oxoglutarate dehydrogenase E2 component (dihydrolipoamide succinyltransferase)
MGEGIIEAEITRWLVRQGDLVSIDDPLVEVATDKVDSEVASPVSGIIHKILLEEGDIAKVGQILAVVRTAEEGEISDPAGSEPGKQAAEPAAPPPETYESNETPDTPETPGTQHQIPNSKFQTPHSTFPPGRVYLSPTVKKIIRENQLSQSEIRSIRGSGKNGRITHRDLLAYLSERRSDRSEAGKAEQVIPEPAGIPEESTVNISREMIYGDENNVVTEMDRMRRLIADHMVYSAKVSPHVTSFAEADVTNLVAWRERVKTAYQEKHNQRLTYTPLLIEAVVKAILEFPGINISVDGYRIIQKKQINIGMATALPSGNLVVPVIREADKKNFHGLVATVNDLAGRARENKLKPNEIKGSTFSITNLGQFGNLSGTPIINQPEVAILAVGAFTKTPAVVATPHGDAIGIRSMVILSLSYDHRVVDGALGGSFLRKIGDLLENADIDREI